MEPGKQAQSRLTIAIRPDDEKLILKIKHKLEAESGERLSVSELFRRGLKCLAEREGLA